MIVFLFQQFWRGFVALVTWIYFDSNKNVTNVTNFPPRGFVTLVTGIHFYPNINVTNMTNPIRGCVTLVIWNLDLLKIIKHYSHHHFNIEKTF